MFKSMKVGWSDQGSRGLREGGGNCLKYLLGGEGSKLGQGVGAIKRGVWNPLTNYGMYFSFIYTSDLII